MHNIAENAFLWQLPFADGIETASFSIVFLCIYLHMHKPYCIELNLTYFLANF